MPNDLHAICEEFRQIGLRPETPAGRERLEEALSSKWDGVQVAAAKVLSQWGDSPSLRSLKVLLSAVAANRSAGPQPVPSPDCLPRTCNCNPQTWSGRSRFSYTNLARTTALCLHLYLRHSPPMRFVGV
jgi:hypothetical protein